MTKEQEEQGFRVTDKRGFKEDGESRATEDSEKAGRPSTTKQTSTRQETASEAEIPPQPPIDFTTFILSYYTQGVVLLGVVPNPDTNKKEEDLEGARHIIELLSMLEEKTKGNLNENEAQLMGRVLYELRMAFMSKTQRIKL